MRFITDQLEVFVFVLVDRIGPTLDDHLRQRIRRARDLLAHLFEMILVTVDVAAGPDEHTRLEITLLREHQQQHGIEDRKSTRLNSSHKFAAHITYYAPKKNRRTRK